MLCKNARTKRAFLRRKGCLTWNDRGVITLFSTASVSRVQNSGKSLLGAGLQNRHVTCRPRASGGHLNQTLEPIPAQVNYLRTCRPPTYRFQSVASHNLLTEPNVHLFGLGPPAQRSWAHQRHHRQQLSARPSTMFSRVRNMMRCQRPTLLPQTENNQEAYEPRPEDYPVFPPMSPRGLIIDRDQQWAKITHRKFAAPQGTFEDSSLYALYRLYEVIVLDKVFAYRNGLEMFWRQKTWAVKDIADPKDDDPERYAFLAGCTYLLARSFNQRIKLGLSRQMPAILLHEQLEELRNRPDELRQYEQVPEWAQHTKALEETLFVPTHDGEVLEGTEDKRADPDFLKKNILLWTPHIFFT